MKLKYVLAFLLMSGLNSFKLYQCAVLVFMMYFTISQVVPTTKQAIYLCL